MTQLFWVRHGPTHETAFTGWRDVPADLSDTAALDRLDAYLPDDALVVSSDLIRAVATADAITGTRDRLPHDRQLREFDFGVWDGMHFAEVAERDPKLSRAFWETPGDIAAPDGESWNGVARRITDAIDAVIAKHPSRPIIAVAHFGAILTHVATAGGLPPYDALGHKIDNLSVTELTLTDGRWQIDRINHCP
ncbi:MAG: histidine phosphatase family protein [Pseudomonadota bacterium]